MLKDPADHRGQAFATLDKRPFAQKLSVRVDDDLVGSGGPADAREDFELRYCFPLFRKSAACGFRQSQYWRSRTRTRSLVLPRRPVARSCVWHCEEGTVDEAQQRSPGSDKYRGCLQISLDGVVMSIRFDFEWTDLQRWPDVRSRCSMALLRVEVNGSVVTKNIDRGDGDLRDRIVVPMFSIAEWLVCNWWHMLYEVDKGEQTQDFAARHDLAFAGDDFVFPNILLKPMSELIQLSWCQCQSPHVGSGSVKTEYVRREDFEEQARNIIEAVLGRLRECDVDAAHLEGEWNAINSLDQEEQEFCRAAALLGADPFDMDDVLADEVQTFREASEPSLREEARAAAELKARHSKGLAG